MSRTVFCKKYQEDLPGLMAPPQPGPKGQELYDSISQKAWDEWMDKQTMLINEKHLSMIDKEHRSYLNEQMEKFFNNEEVDAVEGFVPKQD